MNKKELWYLATPYSKYSSGLDDAFEMACRTAARCIKNGLHVYSPIAHTHPIALHGNIDAYAHEIWLPLDQHFMEAACGLIVVTADGWQESTGVQTEMAEFQRMKKPIWFIPPE